MSFDPVTGGPCSLADERRGALKQIAEVLKANNKIQRDKIARGEVPGYDPDQPLPRRGRYQNYP